ncbi:hypothetical protein [Spirillospora sp. NPDC029432]|uniref:hypothetical protein n=1 Tax=Spirillospora sp. NPDC029432 TaxID=3154599 RepID=UPI0034549CFB
MGLPRPPEPFQRVYSPPDPPSPARGPRLLAMAVALLAFALAAAGVFWLAPGGGGDDRVVPASMPSGDGREAPRSSGGASPAAIGKLPPPCGTVAAGTVGSLIPEAQRRESSNETLTTCTYWSRADGFRWLRVEAYLYAPAHTATPVEDARRYFGAQWAQAHEGGLERTVSLARQSGMGDEAYRRFKVDKGQPTAVGEVTVRVRNAVVTVHYSEQAGAGGADAREAACLGNATRVAREVLRSFR